MKLAIIGGGISGLATGFNIQRENPNIELHIYEANAKLGGTMQTENINGFLFEHGVNGFLTNKPDTLDLVKNAVSEHLLLKSNDLARVRFIYNKGLHLLPESPLAFLTTKLLTARGKMRVLLEPFIPAKKTNSDETLQAFGYRRLGKNMTDIFLDAMVAGVFASSPEKISVNSAFPLVVALEQNYGGLFKGMLKKRQVAASPKGVLMSFTNGVSDFIKDLASKINGKIFLSSKVDKITRLDAGYLLTQGSQSQFYDAVILATPAYATANIIENFDTQLASKLRNIDYSPISVVGFGYEDTHKKLDAKLQGFGLLTPALAKQKILGILWDSSVFANRAAASNKTLRIMIGGQRNKDLALKSREELIAIAKQAVQEIMQIEQEPDAVFVKTYAQGIPNYNLNHQQLVAQIFQLVKNHQNLYLVSNAYNGVSLNDCTKNAQICAKDFLHNISQNSNGA